MRALKKAARPKRARKAPLVRRRVTELPLELGPVARLGVTLVREGLELLREIAVIPTPERCPACGAVEVPSATARTVFACGSSYYDGRPGTFEAGMCRSRARARRAR